jgi:cytochrome c
MSLFQALGIAALLSAFLTTATWAGGDAAHGQALFSSRCAICHTTTAQKKAGPGLAGVYGRAAGTAPNFHYSKAMASYAKRWDDQTLDNFLAAPSKAVPGTAMAVALPNTSDRADIIAYLRTIGP